MTSYILWLNFIHWLAFTVEELGREKEPIWRAEKLKSTVLGCSAMWWVVETSKSQISKALAEWTQVFLQLKTTRAEYVQVKTTRAELVEANSPFHLVPN